MSTSTSPVRLSDTPLPQPTRTETSSGTSRRRRPRRVPSGMPFVLPFLVVAGLFLVGPTIYGLGMSLTDQSLMGGGEFTGVQNYRQAFADPQMWATLGHTVTFTVLSTVPLVLVALVMAVLVYTGIPGQWLWRFAFFAPFLLPVAAVVQIWVWLFQTDVGLINYFLGGLGMGGPGWLTDPALAMWSIVVLTVWWTVGFNFLLYLSALQSIPDQLYEAAALDGAGVFRKLWSIVLPQLAGTTALVTMLQIIASLKVFDQMFIAFDGGAGPGGVTRPILQYIYDTGFTNYRMGYASAMSYVFFALVLAVTAVAVLVNRRRKGA